jgi:SulP family sulfate permease
LVTVMAGGLQFVLGLLRMGMLINFVSHSVIVGFAAGSGILIAANQLRHLLGLTASGDSLLTTLQALVLNLPKSHLPTAAIGGGTILLLTLLRRLNPRLPAVLIAAALSAAIVFALGLHRQGVAVIGGLPSSLPPLADLPLVDLDLIGRLSTSALAIAAIGLVQTTAISRAFAVETGQRLDTNQEFVGQGLANIVAGFFSGYACSASFGASGVNLKAGARTSLAGVFAGLFVLVGMFVLAPAAAYLPRATLAGALIFTAYGLFDRKEIGRIWRGAPGDAAIMIITIMGALFLTLEFAVLAGLFLSLALYILRTSTPRVQAVLPDATFRHLTPQGKRPGCPQLALFEVLGDLYFGAVHHVEETILNHAARHPEQRYLMLRMQNVNHCDFSGIHMLENVVRHYRGQGGDVYLVRVRLPVRVLMDATGFVGFIGRDHFLSEDEAISHLFHRVLDPAVCIYECDARAFRECQNLPRPTYPVGIPQQLEIPNNSVAEISAQDLWRSLHSAAAPPMVVDVREPREYHQGHIPEAELVPLPEILKWTVEMPREQDIVLVCRSGRRSQRAACVMQQHGCQRVRILKGGMLDWESAGLLEAVD